jgi:hypothetical protein
LSFSTSCSPVEIRSRQAARYAHHALLAEPAAAARSADVSTRTVATLTGRASGPHRRDNSYRPPPRLRAARYGVKRAM